MLRTNNRLRAEGEGTMKANMIKVERKKENIIKTLNSFEVSLLIQSLVEYKEGNITIGTLKAITK